MRTETINTALKSSFTLASAAIAAGCSSVHTEEYGENKAAAIALEKDIVDKAEHGIVAIESGMVIDDFYVDTQPFSVPIKKDAQIPQHLNNHINYIQRNLMTEREFTTFLLQEYGLHISFSRLIPSKSEDKKDEKDEAGEDATNISETEHGTLFAAGTEVDDQPQMPSGKNSAYVLPDSKTLETLYKGEVNNPDPDQFLNPMEYNGDLVGFLDMLAADRDLSWKFDSSSDQFVFYDLDTMIFEVIDNTGSFSTDSSVSTESEASSDSSEGGATSSAATSQSISFSDKAEHWLNLESTIKSIVSEYGKVSFDQKNGMVIVTDRKPVLNKIGNIVDQLNDTNGTMVFLDVTYVKVQLDKSSKIGMDFSAEEVISSIGSGSATGGLVTKNPVDTMQSVFSLDLTKAGVSAMIGSLQKYGHVSMKYEMPISTMNNTPHPYQTVVERSYVHKVVEEKNEEGVTTAIIPETKVNKTGLTSIFTPRVFKDSVIVTGILALTDNIDMDTKEEMGNIMLPTNNGETHKIKSKIPNGVTRVVSIQKIVKSSANTDGAMGENSWMLGGSEETENSSELGMVLVTPYIIK